MHVFWLFVKEACVDFMVKGKYTFKGAKATAHVTAAAAAGGGADESNGAIGKANDEARTVVSEGLLGDQGITASSNTFQEQNTERRRKRELECAAAVYLALVKKLLAQSKVGSI